MVSPEMGTRVRDLTSDLASKDLILDLESRFGISKAVLKGYRVFREHPDHSLRFSSVWCGYDIELHPQGLDVASPRILKA